MEGAWREIFRSADVTAPASIRVGRFARLLSGVLAASHGFSVTRVPPRPYHGTSRTALARLSSTVHLGDDFTDLADVRVFWPMAPFEVRRQLFQAPHGVRGAADSMLKKPDLFA